MPPGPIRGLRFVHSALRIQSAQIAEDCARLSEPAETSGLADAVGKLVRAERGHAKGEDGGYFPTLEERAPRVTAPFTFDHHHEDSHLDRLEQLVASCSSQEELAELKQLSVVIRESLDAHMTKEEQLLWPLTEELFSPPEQGAIIGAILAVIPPASMPELISWITEVISAEDAVAYVQLLQRVQPPEVFATTTGWIQSGVSPDRWQHLGSEIPGLG